MIRAYAPIALLRARPGNHLPGLRGEGLIRFATGLSTLRRVARPATPRSPTNVGVMTSTEQPASSVPSRGTVTKAVIPAAGLGTRFLPATKATPKEMLPVVDKPAIQYVVEEATRAGQRDVLMVTGRNKTALELPMTVEVVLERGLVASGHHEDIAQPGARGLFDDVLDGRLVDDRQHLLRRRLGRGQEAGAQTGCRDHGLGDRAPRGHGCCRLLGRGHGPDISRTVARSVRPGHVPDPWPGRRRCRPPATARWTSGPARATMPRRC